MQLKKHLPNGIAVFSDLYGGHIMFSGVIAIALFAGGYLLH